MFFLGVAGAIFAVIAISIPMVIIASSLAESPTAAPPPTSGGGLPGEDIAASTGCLACHTTDGSDSVGPTWLGVAGTDREMESGEVVLADDAYLTESIVAPLVRIVAGYQAVMPEGYDQTLSEQDITDIVEYLNSLG